MSIVQDPEYADYKKHAVHHNLMSICRPQPSSQNGHTTRQSKWICYACTRKKLIHMSPHSSFPFNVHNYSPFGGLKKPSGQARKGLLLAIYTERKTDLCGYTHIPFYTGDSRTDKSTGAIHFISFLPPSNMHTLTTQ